MLVHDCAHNSDIFDKELNEGLTSMIICSAGNLPNVAEPTVLIGGNCSIIALDLESEERFWTVSGGKVTAL